MFKLSRIVIWFTEPNHEEVDWNEGIYPFFSIEIIVIWRDQFFSNLGKHRSPVSNLCSTGEQTLGERFSFLEDNFGNVSPFLVGAKNTFSELAHPLIKLPNCVVKFYNLSEVLGTFGLLPPRGAGTGFFCSLPLPLIFDPLLYILHFTEKQC